MGLVSDLILSIMIWNQADLRTSCLGVEMN